MFQMKRFVEEYARIHNVQFGVTLAFQSDPGQMYIVEYSLTPPERLVCQNAISAMSDQLNANLSKDPWQASANLTAELRRQLEEIRDLIDREISGNS